MHGAVYDEHDKDVHPKLTCVCEREGTIRYEQKSFECQSNARF